MDSYLPITWDKSYRLISSHFPPINLFESVANPEDLEIIWELESLTNDRLKDECGDLSLVLPEDRVSGAGTSPIMAAFTHIGVPSRFTDGHFGVYYAANSRKTALAETIYHRENFLRATQEEDCEITMREYVGKVDAHLLDARDRQQYQQLYSLDDYSYSQQFAANVHAQNSDGIVYESVRDPKGECVALFKPKAISPVVQGVHLRYVWSGSEQKIVGVFTVSELTNG